MRNKRAKYFCMILAVLLCIGLSACQSQKTDRPEDQPEPVKKEEEIKDLPLEADETDAEGESTVAEEDSASEPEESDTNSSETAEETTPDAEEE